MQEFDRKYQPGSEPGWIGRILGSRYKLVGTLATLLALGLSLYLLLPRLFPSPSQSEIQELPPSSETERGVLFRDDFTDPNGGWLSGSRGESSYGYQPPGSYYIEVNGSNESLTVFRGLNFENFTAEAEVLVNYAGTLSGDFRYGLAIRRSGENFYAFTIFPGAKTWQVLKHSPTGVKVLDEGSHELIQRLYQLYTLSVDAGDATFSFRINGQAVTKLTDPDFVSGDVGFIVETFDESLAHVSYHWLIIRDYEGETVAIVPADTVTPSLPGPTPGPLSTATPVTPSPTPGPLPAATPAPPTPTPVPAATPVTPSPTPTSTPTATPVTPTATPQPPPTSASAPPTATPALVATVTATATPTASIPSGTFALLKPLNLNEPSRGPTEFEWKWTGTLPPEFGFEVRVWREGEQPAGVHDAVLDNKEGRIERVDENGYRLKVDITKAAGVRGRSGEYLWTVVLVKISPAYADLGQQAAPARFRFAAGGSGDDGGSSSQGGGVGVD